MNSSGPTSAPLRRQRSSTSSARGRRVSVHMIGWKCSANSSRASAPRRLDSSSKWRAAAWFMRSVKNW